MSGQASLSLPSAPAGIHFGGCLGRSLQAPSFCICSKFVEVGAMPIKEVTQGRDVRIFHPELVNLYGCSIGDETRIGTFVEIQKNASIGSRCKISSHTFICEGVD